MPSVLPHRSLIQPKKRQFTRPVEHYRRAVWRGRSIDGVDHQAILLGAS